MQRPWTSLRRFLSLPAHPRTSVRHRPPGQGLRLEQLETRLVPTVSLLNNFDGMNVFNSGGVPPDTCGAAGPTRYIESVNAAVSIYDKATNAVIASDSLGDFLFTQGGLSSSWGLLDATMVYDEFTGQFIVGDLGDKPDGSSALNIAVSHDSNPTTLDASSWNFYTIDTTEANEFADYPGNMGFNADAFCFTFNMFPTNGAGTFHVEVAAISQSSLAAGGSLAVNRFDESGFSWRPVTMHSSTPGGPMWFVTEHGDGSSIDLQRVDNILASPTTTPFNIAVTPYDFANASLNPDGSVITQFDTRIQKAAESNNEIVACQAIGVGSNENDARWYQFDVNNPDAPFLVQQGNVGLGANTYTVNPAIDINQIGDIGMVFTTSGNDTSTDYMSTYITGWSALIDAPGTMETPVQVRAGDSNNLDGREGDFSGINVDVNDGTFWVAGEYAFSNSWGTEVAQFAMTTAPTLPQVSRADRVSDQNDQAMTPAQATSDRAVNFVLQNNGDLYEIVYGSPMYLAPGIAALSPQGIDNNGHAMVDVVTPGGAAYEFHDQVGWNYLWGGSVRSAVAGQGVSYVLFTNGLVEEYHDATGTFTYLYNGVRQIDAGTDQLGVDCVDIVFSSGDAYEYTTPAA